MTERRGTNNLLGCMSLVLMKMGRGNPYDRGMAYILGETTLTVRYKGNPKSELYEMVIDD